MQDRLRFRAWNKECESYAYNIQDFGSFYPNPCWQDSFGDFLEDDDWIIEQCTGLKDKNGKLIYEGDIVHSSLDGGTQKVIYWDDGLASFMAYNRYPDKLYTQRIGDGYFIELGFEVIGNIHENAYLLEK